MIWGSVIMSQVISVEFAVPQTIWKYDGERGDMVVKDIEVEGYKAGTCIGFFNSEFMKHSPDFQISKEDFAKFAEKFLAVYKLESEH